jgi:alkylation response protein AidB-like acyl-CoA dehydrogenase
VRQTDSTGVLKTIERYAVECSVNKVYTSEALAYVVDEAVQVFGGNGYSREFPVERAYRDARITRIYEGTNEINRLIIATRLLKQGPQGSEGSPESPGSPRSPGSQGGRALDAERAMLGQAKRLALTALSEVTAAYGEEARQEQEVLAHTADVVIDIYAIESALARTEKLVAARAASAAVAVDAARVFVSDAADRMTHAARQVQRALAGRGHGAPLGDRMAPLAAFDGIDTVAARRRVADAVIAAGKHPF